MEQQHRDLIMKNIDFLIENTPDEEFGNLLKKFSEGNGLSPFMLKKINERTNTNEKKRKFYEMVPKRGPEAYAKLINSFYSSGLRYLADHLKNSKLLVDGCCYSVQNGSPKAQKQSSNECYLLKSNPKGYVLIINIKEFKFEKSENRHGSEKDVAYLTKVWEKLSYYVIIKENLELQEFKNEIDAFIDLTCSKKLDSVFIFIMTHGSRDERNSREVQLKMSDSQLVNSDWVLERFSSIHCKYIADIPKVIFIQACRGNQRDLGHWLAYDSGPRTSANNNNVTDSNRSFTPKPHYSNLLLVFSTLPGFVAKRDPDNGAPFIQELCRIIEKKSKESHLIEIIDEVNRNLEEEVVQSLKKSQNNFFQTVQYENWCFSYKLYLK